MKRLFAILMLCWVPTLAEAEPWFIEAAIGSAHHYRYHSEGDNYWRTDAYPGESYDMDSLSWRIGVGRKLTGNWSKWSMTASWVNLGRNQIRNGRGVSDDDYDSNNHVCLRRCDQVYRVDLTGKAKGPEFAVRRDFDNGLYARGGLFLWLSEVRGTIQDPSGYAHPYYERKEMLAPFLGLGYRYQWVFVEATGYQALGSGFPLSKRIVSMMGGLQIPF